MGGAVLVLLGVDLSLMTLLVVLLAVLWVTFVWLVSWGLSTMGARGSAV